MILRDKKATPFHSEVWYKYRLKEVLVNLTQRRRPWAMGQASICNAYAPLNLPPALLQLTKILNSFSVFDAVVSEFQWKRASIVDDYRFCGPLLL